MTWLDVVFRKTTLTAVQRMSWRTGLSQGGPSGNTVEQDACNVRCDGDTQLEDGVGRKSYVWGVEGNASFHAWYSLLHGGGCLVESPQA